MPTTRKRSYPASTGNTQVKKTKVGPTVKHDSGFQGPNNAQVHIDSDDCIWDASLNLSNVGGNQNKFYNLQVLNSHGRGKAARFYSHARWGRVGEPGQSKTTDHPSLSAAKKDFEKKFKDKTGLEWSDRTSTPKDGKYTFVQKSYEEDDDEDDDAQKSDSNNGSAIQKSKLDLPTQRLMELIFNENHFNAVLEEMGYNKDKTPLGKLSKDVLKQGFEQLRELASLVRHPSLAKNKYNRDRKDVIEEWTNKYYSTIPHSFGRQRPPAIDNHDAVAREVAMLDALTDMGVANTIMRATQKAKDSASVNELDRHFENLNLKEFTHIDNMSTEYHAIQKLLLDTSSDSHAYRYRLQDIFRVERYGEADRFKDATEKVKDKKSLLLWHGSRSTNYGGILSQGLRVPPSEAPPHSYAFGKGIYLSDCSSLSMSFAMPALTGMVGLLLLVEAQMSKNMYEPTSPGPDAEKEAKRLNLIATKAAGSEVPAAWKDASCISNDLKGILMPDGRLASRPGQKAVGSKWNEYVCYNAAHLKIRYIVKVGL